MDTTLYVGNLPFYTEEADLTRKFANYGTVTRASVVHDTATGRGRGFAFVEMATTEEAEAAIAALDGSNLEGRALQVSVAKLK
jgi:RNA recognition motif-containing protein